MKPFTFTLIMTELVHTMQSPQKLKDYFYSLDEIIELTEGQAKMMKNSDTTKLEFWQYYILNSVKHTQTYHT